MTQSPGDALDILANAVSRLEEIDKSNRTPVAASEHRVSCHRCGNIRKKKLCCPRPDCPHIFCGRCADKLRAEHGDDVFLGGCPVCKELCCCSNKTIYCERKNHCYRKCPSTKSKLFNANALPANPSSEALHTTTLAQDSQWDQEAKNCRAPALDFLASIVTNTGTDVPAAIIADVGISIRKVDSVKSIASESSASSSMDSKRTPRDADIFNSNGKRTPSESPAPDAKMMKAGIIPENVPKFKVPSIPETIPAGSQSTVFSNLPMPSGQIPQMNNNGQFNQNFLLDKAAGGHASETNKTQNFVLQNQLPSTVEGQKLGEGMQFPYYFTDIQGSIQQQSLVYPVTNFANGPGGVNGVGKIPEAETVQTGVM